MAKLETGDKIRCWRKFEHYECFLDINACSIPACEDQQHTELMFTDVLSWPEPSRAAVTHDMYHFRINETVHQQWSRTTCF